MTAEALEPFHGWALCLPENVLEQLDTSISEYFSAQEIRLEGQATGSKPGRPAYDRAKAAFAEMGFDKGELSWGQLVKKIEAKTGEKPNPRTFRGWAAQAAPNRP